MCVKRTLARLARYMRLCLMFVAVPGEGAPDNEW